MKKETIQQIKDVLKVFPDAKLYVYYATKEQIERLKKNKIRGISRKQRN